MDDLPYVNYACFVLHNFCELNNESVCDDEVRRAVDYDREFQLLCFRTGIQQIVMRQRARKSGEFLPATLTLEYNYY